MIAPNCPDHGRLALDLAQGRLDDDAALHADEILAACPVCREWWRTQFEGEASATVDEAVAAVFGDLRLPARRRSHGWMAVAAAAVMAIGAATLWLASSPDAAAPAPVEVAAIQSIDFEQPELQLLAIASSDDLDLQRETPRPLFVPGPVGTDEPRVAEATQAAADEPPLFTGGFESGSLAGWGVPST
ncbi:MAG: hypothetical protein V2I67_14245 [Thermoanaerobaculales bacterium]|nr:hypothetical protein [Thermoanaerobaculales bacterium]